VKRRWLGLLLGCAALVPFGCSEAEVVTELRSLQGSEDVAFLCVDQTGNSHPLENCPDLDERDDAELGGRLSLMALVTQTISDEVAVINVTDGEVVDVDPTTPGIGFLPVGARPVAIVSSPGGTATFVAVAGPGRDALFALPTSCVSKPAAGEGDVRRDLTLWPACRLPSAPGEVALVVEPPDERGRIFTSCDGGEIQSRAPAAANDEYCPANLEIEEGPPGRRKLLVSLPESGEILVIDAQTLLDRGRGDFAECDIERRLPLRVDIPPGVEQTVPSDLELPQDADQSCLGLSSPQAPATPPRPPAPAGFALTEDRLYVADEAAPVIHVLDVAAPCSLRELPSLLPRAFRDPQRVVTTRRLAASPPTPSGKRYLYAIDAEDQPGASVMVFDVTPGSTDPTPLVRSGSAELPREKADRLQLGSSARDVTFAYRDLPYADPVTGLSTFGVACNPLPDVPDTSAGALARPNSDYSEGARPALLRGLFAFILLTNGQIAIVDVEDFDAPCRRPVTVNASPEPDFRGCSGDPEGVELFTSDGTLEGTRTVTDEISCRVVEPHRFRSATLPLESTDLGVRAPALRGFPQLVLPTGAASTRIEDRPRLLAAPFPTVSGEGESTPRVLVGSTLYGTEENPLPLDPNGRETEQAATLQSVALPPLQPRAYATEDTVAVTYEGTYSGERTAGFLRLADDGTQLLADATLSFCTAGVYDVRMMSELAEQELGLTPEQAEAFAYEHADYVQLTTALLPEDDSYWNRQSRAECEQLFGPHDVDELQPTRDLLVLGAFADRLEVEPRRDPTTEAITFEQLQACFPTVNKYVLRGGRHWIVTHASSGFNHDVTTGLDNICQRSCDPLRRWAKGRAFEVSSESPACHAGLSEELADPLTLRVGCAHPGEVACVFDQSAEAGVRVGGRASECIFDGLTERFVIYRGRRQSERGATFTWQTTGGFVPLLMSLLDVSTSAAPQSIRFVPNTELVAVVDGAGLGLSLLNIDLFSVVRPSPFY
jgi:hypothetical protein